MRTYSVIISASSTISVVSFSQPIQSRELIELRIRPISSPLHSLRRILSSFVTINMSDPSERGVCSCRYTRTYRTPKISLRGLQSFVQSKEVDKAIVNKTYCCKHSHQQPIVPQQPISLSDLSRLRSARKVYWSLHVFRLGYLLVQRILHHCR